MGRYSSPVSYFWGAICTLFGAFSLNEIAVIIGGYV
ncbi:HP1 family phage holin [Orbus sturtevantii]